MGLGGGYGGDDGDGGGGVVEKDQGGIAVMIFFVGISDVGDFIACCVETHL